MESSSGLDKLLPKSLATKRRRRKQKKALDNEPADEHDENRGRRFSSRSELSTSPMESDDTNSTNNDEADGRSFGSYESNAEPSIITNPDVES